MFFKSISIFNNIRFLNVKKKIAVSNITINKQRGYSAFRHSLDQKMVKAKQEQFLDQKMVKAKQEQK